MFFKRKQDGHRVFNPNFFLWNASDICSQFRETITDTSKFCDKLNQLTGSPSLVVTQAQIHREDNLSEESSSTFDWDISGDDVPDITSTNGVVHSTPARLSGRTEAEVMSPPLEAGAAQSNLPVEDPPVLFKKKREVEMSVEHRIMEEVKKAYLGSARIPTAHLKLGTQLRQIREPFVVELMAKMTEFPGHFYQPLCVIIDNLDDSSHFKETNASGYHYSVIGGCHNYSAAKRLNQMYPAQDIFKSRLCSIYSNSLSAEANLWLANRHNKVGEFRHHMSLKEKIQLCRNIFETSGMDIASKDWHTTVTTILSPEESKGVIKLLIKLATVENETYQLLHEVLSSHSNGQLKGQNLTPSDITSGPNLKPYALRSIPGLPASAAQQVLSEVRDGSMSMPEFQKETKLLLKLQTVQKMFLDLLGLKSWDEARNRYPMASTREVLEHFCKFNLRSTPPELKTFCHQLKMEDTANSTEAFRGDRGSLGYPVHCDVLLLDCETILEAEWTWTDVKTFANNMTSVNIQHQVDSFSLVVLSTVSELSSVEKAITESRHFSESVTAFYMVQNETKGTGCLAALLEDRCVLSLECDEAKIRHMKVRVNTSFGGSCNKKRVADCAGDEEDIQDSEEEASSHESGDEVASSLQFEC
ncbi:hypothetical protein HOLleu_01154 [Holothuria leucospilota]|uniref:Uncharacterized protein n=1 Tax=Holothuria leucospilota TaxID=206669 RepID=A0A9Q1CNZ3_HOLLE|nr:hypothetical protein HOLleu_01154 [Holothuria leucospilota]